MKGNFGPALLMPARGACLLLLWDLVLDLGLVPVLLSEFGF